VEQAGTLPWKTFLPTFWSLLEGTKNLQIRLQRPEKMQFRTFPLAQLILDDKDLTIETFPVRDLLKSLTFD